MSIRQDKWQGMNWIRQDKRLSIYIRDNFTCAYCGIDMKTNLPEGRRIELDHIVPCSENGSNDATNLITCCGGVGGCNQRRQDRAIDIFCPKSYKDILVQAQLPLNRTLAKQILAERKNNKEV